MSPADPKKAVSKADSRPAEKSADLGNIPESGVRAKGISEKSISEKAAADRATVEKPAEKADRPSETASIPPVAPTEKGRHQPIPKEKTVSKTPPAPAAEPVAAAAPVTTPPAEASVTPDANDLARAAIERLRGNEPAPRGQETARLPEPPKAAEPPRTAVVTPAAPAAPVASAPSLQPLPPPILVSTPATVDAKPPVARADDPARPTPPADIPDAHPPLDLRADAVDQPVKRPNVAEDVLSATKKLFNSVLPKQQQQ
jgi:hypothetical protein